MEVRIPVIPTACVPSAVPNVASSKAKLLTVLHVEDDDNDAILLRKACERVGLPVKLHRVADGEEAKAYLLGQGQYADRSRHPLPNVMVLDLKLPRINGFQLLHWLRAQNGFTKLPVLVFTASLSREDRTRALGKGATAYFVKPTSFEALVEVVEAMRINGPAAQ